MGIYEDLFLVIYAIEIESPEGLPWITCCVSSLSKVFGSKWIGGQHVSQNNILINFQQPQINTGARLSDILSTLKYTYSQTMISYYLVWLFVWINNFERILYQSSLWCIIKGRVTFICINVDKKHRQLWQIQVTT